MSQLFGRIIRVNIADILISNVHIRFELHRESDDTVPSGEITIWNLARATEDRIFERGGTVRLEAGYPSTVASLFDGAVEKIVRERAELARLTRITLTGKATPAGLETPAISHIGPFSSPIGLRSLALQFASDMGLSVGPLDAIDDSLTVSNWSFSGASFVGLNDVTRRAGVTWFEDDGVVRFNKTGQPQMDATSLSLSPLVGLIGSPAVTEQGVRCRSFLQPLARVGGIISLQSENVSGRYKIAAVSHLGDNWDGDFVTEYDLRVIEGAPVNAIQNPLGANLNSVPVPLLLQP